MAYAHTNIEIKPVFGVDFTPGPVHHRLGRMGRPAQRRSRASADAEAGGGASSCSISPTAEVCPSGHRRRSGGRFARGHGRARQEPLALRFLLNLLAMLAVALVVGFGLTWYALTDGRLFGAYQIGPWTAWPEAGSPAPDPYTRAFLARSGALQLGQSEGLQFVATTDSDGQPLDRNCRYRIDGTTPAATFWTLVPVDAERRQHRPPGRAGGLPQRPHRARQ